MTLPSIAAHAKIHLISPQKKLGQNFIFDASLCDKIVRAAPSVTDRYVLEVGPGPAGLTRSILACSPLMLTVIEKDKRCIDLLSEIKNIYNNLQIIEGDALEIRVQELAPKDKLIIIANLPYNIGTELVFRWLEDATLIESITVMLQKEVVERICAKPGSKAYGRLSVMCQILCNVRKEFDVSPAAFYPPPKVHSSVVTLTPLTNLPSAEIVALAREITKNAFGARRKMIKTSLKSIPDDIFKKLGIDTSIRAENISPEQYLMLAKEVL